MKIKREVQKVFSIVHTLHVQDMHKFNSFSTSNTIFFFARDFVNLVQANKIDIFINDCQWVVKGSMLSPKTKRSLSNIKTACVLVLSVSAVSNIKLFKPNNQLLKFFKKSFIMKFVIVFSVLLVSALARPADDSKDAQILKYEVSAFWFSRELWRVLINEI